MTEAIPGSIRPLDNTRLKSRWDHIPLYRWWRLSVVGSVEHESVVERIIEESGWSPRFAFMTMMSAGIAILGLLLSSPAVVIGAMLISPLMSPILGLGFSLALFDFAEMRRSMTALAIGTLAAVAFTVIIVMASPLKATTAEILARTRPSLFDMLVALFSALAGTFAVIRGRGETIVGVAIATALMPPLAVVGYGIATWNMPVITGAFALFVTNFVTIALAAMILARFYGFGHALSGRQSMAQTLLLLAVFVAMAVPLAISLGQIAREAVVTSQVRGVLSERFGDNARVTQLEIEFDAEPLLIRSVIIAPRNSTRSLTDVQAQLQQKLGRPVRLQLDQVLLTPGAGSIDAQRAELRQSSETVAAARAADQAVARLVSIAAGVDVDRITLDHDHRRVVATAAELPGAGLETYFVLEQRASAAADGWTVNIVPPMGLMPTVRFADGSDVLDSTARRAVLLSAWAAARWNIPAIAVPGLPDTASETPALNERRAAAIAALLREKGVRATPAPVAGTAFRLAAAGAAQQQ